MDLKVLLGIFAIGSFAASILFNELVINKWERERYAKRIK